jgi:hypothetical protein
MGDEMGRHPANQGRVSHQSLAQRLHRPITVGCGRPIAENKPYDQFVREMLTSSGSNFRVGPGQTSIVPSRTGQPERNRRRGCV